MNGLAHLLEATADACRDADVTGGRDAQDAVVIAAMRTGYEVLGLAQRILVAQREYDEQLNDRRPYPPPKPPPSPPPKDPKGQG